MRESLVGSDGGQADVIVRRCIGVGGSLLADLPGAAAQHVRVEGGAAILRYSGAGAVISSVHAKLSDDTKSSMPKLGVSISNQASISKG